jgi:hypothetical protein
MNPEPLNPKGRRVVLIRAPDFSEYPDGDAMNGFARSTNPPGLVVRLTHHVVDTHVGDP